MEINSMEFFSATAECSTMKPSKLESLLSPEMHPERVGARLTALREALKMQKSQFADSVGIDRSALTRIEKGSEGLGISKAVIISDIYGFGLNYIYKGDLSDVPLDVRPRLLEELHHLGALPAQKLPTRDR
jgi:transcriptional regulator with XRE-family HTH domain